MYFPPGRRPDSDFEITNRDYDVFITPGLLYHSHSRTRQATIQMKESRKLLLELAVATEPKSETVLSKLTSIDRHTIRSYCRKFLESELVEWNYVTRGRYTEKLSRLTPLGKAFALSVALEEGRLSPQARRRLLTEYIESMHPMMATYPIHGLGERFIRFLLEKGHYDILLWWVSYSVQYLRNNPHPHFWSLTWLTFQKDLEESQLKTALECLESFGETLPPDLAPVFRYLVEEFQPTPERQKRKLLGIPDLKEIFKMHPELKKQFDHLKDEPDFQTVRGSIVRLDIDPELAKKKELVRLRNMGGGVYKAERAE